MSAVHPLGWVGIARLGPGLVEGGTAVMHAPAPAYAGVFLLQALLFLVSARLVVSAALAPVSA